MMMMKDEAQERSRHQRWLLFLYATHTVVLLGGVWIGYKAHQAHHHDGSTWDRPALNLDDCFLDSRRVITCSRDDSRSKAR